MTTTSETTVRCDRAGRPAALTPTATAARRRAKAGFSLLEVLGAIAILGIWFAIIAEIAMVGLRNEGLSQRTLMASLVADDVLSQIEIDMLTGTKLEIDSTEEETEDGYFIRIDIEPYELELGPPSSSQRGARGEEPPGKTFQHLAGLEQDAHSPILSIRVEVAWLEGNHEAFVSRYTFGLDSSRAKEALGAMRQQQGQPLDDDGDVGDNALPRL